jgi:hypothetical protein
MKFILTLIIFPLLMVGMGLSVRPFPLRVDAADPAERRAQHCLRISFLLIAVPAAVAGVIIALFIHSFSTDAGLLAYRSSFLVGCRLWKLSSIVGIVFGIGACFPPKQRGQGYELIATHVALLLVVIVGSYFQYASYGD